MDYRKATLEDAAQVTESKEAWNCMGYQCFREQARKCVE